MSCADWSGCVPPPNSRKYIPPKPSKIEGGVGNDADWKPNRKVFSEKTTNSTTHILGGPVPITNPSVVSSCAWETESQSVQQKVKTSQEQLTVSLSMLTNDIFYPIICPYIPLYFCIYPGIWPKYVCQGQSKYYASV